MTIFERVLPRIGTMFSRLPAWLESLFLVVLCWQLAGLLWMLSSPSTADVNLVLPRPAPDNGLVTRDAFLRWYGSDGNTASEAPSDYTLLAVIAGKNGVALLKSGETSVAVRVGMEIRPGSKLMAVEPNQITIEQAGVRKEIKFSPPSSAAAPLFAKVAPATATATTTIRALPPIRLTRGQMANLIQGGNLGNWDKGLAAVADGGIRIESASSQPLARLLQLKSGDILKRINQRPLDQLADISLVFHYFGQSAPVDLVLVRNGAQLTQHYEIQP